MNRYENLGEAKPTEVDLQCIMLILTVHLHSVYVLRCMACEARKSTQKLECFLEHILCSAVSQRELNLFKKLYRVSTSPICA